MIIMRSPTLLIDLKEKHPIVGDYITIILPNDTGKYGGKALDLITRISKVTHNYSTLKGGIDKFRYDDLTIETAPLDLEWYQSIRCNVFKNTTKGFMWYRRKPFEDNSIRAIQQRGIHGMDNLYSTYNIDFGVN